MRRSAGATLCGTRRQCAGCDCKAAGGAAAASGAGPTEPSPRGSRRAAAFFTARCRGRVRGRRLGGSGAAARRARHSTAQSYAATRGAGAVCRLAQGAPRRMGGVSELRSVCGHACVPPLGSCRVRVHGKQLGAHTVRWVHQRARGRTLSHGCVMSTRGHTAAASHHDQATCAARRPSRRASRATRRTPRSVAPPHTSQACSSASRPAATPSPRRRRRRRARGRRRPCRRATGRCRT